MNVAPGSEIIYIAVIFFSLILSFFFSGSETAFVAVNKVRIEVWRRRKDRRVNILLPFLEHPEKFLYTALIGNNIFNVTFASVATIYFNNYMYAEVTWVLIVLLTVFFGEIIPKTLFRSMADLLIRKIAYPMQFFHIIFRAPIWFVSKISELILRLFGYQSEALKNFFSEKDIEILLNESQEMVMRNDPVEGGVFSGILNLRGLWVRDAMVPRTEIIAVHMDTSLEDVQALFEKNGITKLPVYNGTLDNVIGVVLLRDLFLSPQTLKEVIREIMMVPETKRCSELLSEFRHNNTSIAIVIDEYGGTAGLITTEDLVEELFGDIEDEDDTQEHWVRQIDENTYRVNARIDIEKFNEKLSAHIPEGDYETLAGFILEKLGHIPRRDEAFNHQQLRFVVSRATRRKIEWVDVFVRNP